MLCHFDNYFRNRHEQSCHTENGIMIKRTGAAEIISAVRQAIQSHDLAKAERLLRNYRGENGNTPEALEALAWLARGSFAARRFAKAADYARTVHRAIVRIADPMELDSEPSLASALGASIEVLAQTKDRQERCPEAVRFLQKELAEYGGTSIGTRIRKNLNLLTLERQPAPELEMPEWIGRKPSPLSTLGGRAILLFFWAHYCEDSRAQGRALARIRGKFPENSLALIGPTRRYGYLDEHNRKPASRRQETAHVQAVLDQYYPSLSQMPVPVSERNFYIYGASTTPTLVLIDGAGIVSLYHPGKLPYRDLLLHIHRVMA